MDAPSANKKRGPSPTVGFISPEGCQVGWRSAGSLFDGHSSGEESLCASVNCRVQATAVFMEIIAVLLSFHLPRGQMIFHAARLSTHPINQSGAGGAVRGGGGVSRGGLLEIYILLS